MRRLGVFAALTAEAAEQMRKTTKEAEYLGEEGGALMHLNKVADPGSGIRRVMPGRYQVSGSVYI